MHKITSDEFLENCQKVGIYYQEILTHILNNKNFVAPLKYSVNEKYQETTSKLFEQIIEHPEKFTDINLEYVQSFQRLISDSVNKFIGKKDKSVAEEESTDRRFKDPEWNQNIYFDFIKQYYLITSDWMQKGIEQWKHKYFVS